MKQLRAIFDGLIGLLALLAMMLITLVMLVVSADVVMRYFFNRPMAWVLESTQYALMFITFLGTAWVLKEDGHVNVDLVINLLGQKSQSWLNVITSVLAAMVCLVVTWYGVKVEWDYFQIKYFYEGTIRIPGYLLIAIIPIAGFLLFIQFLRRASGYTRKLRAPTH